MKLIRRSSVSLLAALLVLFGMGVARPAQAAPRRALAGRASAGPVADAGYWLVGAGGGVFAFGAAVAAGSVETAPARPIVGMASTPSGDGYWLVGSDGGVFAFGDAGFRGSMGGRPLSRPIVGMASTPSGHGYWLVASDGGIFSFGDAAFHGSTGDVALSRPIVGMASTTSGGGYWLVASDGGIFSFGDAAFHGSTGAAALNKPVVGMSATSSGGGYWLVASDGGIFTFGDAAFHGSTGAMMLHQPIVGMAASDSGYWLVASDGGIFSFGDAAFAGSTGNTTLAKPIVAMSKARGGRGPVVTGLSPGSGPVTGGTLVTITGTGFGGTTGVAFGNRPATGIIVLSATEVTAISPAGTGTVDVSVSSPNGTSVASSADSFAYGAVPGAPTDVTAENGFGCSLLVTLQAPDRVGSSPITAYTVTGVSADYSFTDPGTLVLGRISMDLLGVPDGTYTFTAHATNVAGDGPESLPSNSAVSANCGTPDPATVTSVTPSSGPVAGGTPVVVTGAGFTGATMVSFGGVPATQVVVVSDASITAVSPPGVPGAPPVHVQVPGQGGRSDPGPADLFTYLPDPNVPSAPAKPGLSIVCNTATIVFSAPASSGTSPITGYTASSPGGFSGSSSIVGPIVVGGLLPGSYTFKVHATNAFGPGPESAWSDTVRTTSC